MRSTTIYVVRHKLNGAILNNWWPSRAQAIRSLERRRKDDPHNLINGFSPGSLEIIPLKMAMDGKGKL